LARFFHVTFHGDCFEWAFLAPGLFVVEAYGLRFIPAANCAARSSWRQRRAASPKSDREFFDRVTERRKAWDEMLDKQCDLARSKDRIYPQAVARAVSDLAARDAVFVFDTGRGDRGTGPENGH
jgi:hypothetical protein